MRNSIIYKEIYVIVTGALPLLKKAIAKHIHRNGIRINSHVITNELRYTTIFKTSSNEWYIAINTS